MELGLERNKNIFNNSVVSAIVFAFPIKQSISTHKYVLAVSQGPVFAMFWGDLADKREIIGITAIQTPSFRVDFIIS